MSLGDAASSDPVAAYAVGKSLKLLPHNDPTPPYGGPKYGWLGDEREDELARSRINHPSNYTPPDQVNKGETLKLKVLELTRDPAKHAPQGPLLLVCSVEQATTAKLNNGMRLRKNGIVVAEVFDDLLYDTLVLPFAPVLSSTQQADSGLSRTAGIYRRLHPEGDDKVKFTGPPHIAPQYHGTWVIQQTLTEFKKGFKDTSTRYVGAVLREHVEGPSIESVCVRHECDGLFPLRKIRPHEGLDEISLDRETRLDIMKQIIDGCVTHKKLHIEHEGPKARNYIITLRRNGNTFEKPQVVQVNFTHTYLWDMTIWAEAQEKNHVRHRRISTLPHPLHPTEVYDISSLSDFAGWFPWHWAHGAHRRKGMSLMYRWFLQPDVFGPREEGPKYSLLATLDQQDEAKDEVASLPFRQLSTDSRRTVGSEYTATSGPSEVSGRSGRSGRSRRGEGSGDTHDDDLDI